MKFKYIFSQIILALGILFFMACNNDSEYDVATLSSDSQINLFKVTSRPLNAADSLVFDAFPKAFFTILSSETAGYYIFNQDSLPPRTRIGTMKVTVSYTTPPNKVDLLYLDVNRTDSIVTWKTEDSVKFIYDNQHKIFYPKFTVVAPNAVNKRTYTVDFRVHDINPDSIAWNMATTSAGKDFTLPKKGESKVVSNKDKSEFYSLIKSEGIAYFCTSSVQSPDWNIIDATALPYSVVVNSLIGQDDMLYVTTEEGDIYSANAKSYGGWSPVNNSKKVKSIVGILPADNTNLSNNFILTYYQDGDQLAIARTTDFVNIEDVSIVGKTNNFVEPGFPVQDFSNLYHSLDNKDYLLLLGGKDMDENLARSTWYISSDIGNDNAIVVMPGSENSMLPYQQGITGFAYDEKVQALSADSLRLYSSLNGQRWVQQSDSLRLPKEMKSMNKASVVVDNDNFIWVFGGSDNAANQQFSQQIWKGRINSLASGYIKD